MFVFEKLTVYQKSVELYTCISKLGLGSGYQEKIIAGQLMRCALSVPLNIAEGSGKQTLKDRKNFLLISRGSLYETVSLLNILKANETIDFQTHTELYMIAEEVSKMLRAMIKKHTDEISLSAKK